MLIRTPGTTAPVGSVRVPVMVPRSWARHTIENSTIPARSRTFVIVWFPFCKDLTLRYTQSGFACSLLRIHLQHNIVNQLSPIEQNLVRRFRGHVYNVSGPERLLLSAF